MSIWDNLEKITDKPYNLEALKNLRKMSWTYKVYVDTNLSFTTIK